jgi:Transglutaminase-like superfamily
MLGSKPSPTPATNAVIARAQFLQATSLGGRCRLHYEFVNAQSVPLDVWMALPPTLITQSDIQLHWQQAQPVQVTHTGPNRIAFFTLQPAQRIGLQLTAQLHATRLVAQSAPTAAPPLVPDDREGYLKSSAQIQVSDDVRQLALSVVGEATEPLARAAKLYEHVLRNCVYLWPPPDRGSEALRRSGSGDCGDYSALYAALCRALGIPCRVLYGTWAFGKMQAHTWNEVYIDGLGWLPVDTSGDQSQSVLPTEFFKHGFVKRMLRRFGQSHGNRFAFSIEPDVHLIPAYADLDSVPDGVERPVIAGVPLAWGFQSMGGCVPYLQPAYLRFHAFEPPAAAQETFGSWRFRTATSHADLAGFIAVAVGALMALMGRWMQQPGLTGAGMIALLMLCLAGTPTSRTVARFALVTLVLVESLRRWVQG